MAERNGLRPTRYVKATCSTGGSLAKSRMTSANQSQATSPSPPNGHAKTRTTRGVSAPTKATSWATRPPPSPHKTAPATLNSTKSPIQLAPAECTIVFPWLWAATGTPMLGDSTTMANSATGQPPTGLRRSWLGSLIPRRIRICLLTSPTCRSAPDTIIPWPWAATGTCTHGDATTTASSATTPAAPIHIRLFLCACATQPTPETQARD